MSQAWQATQQHNLRCTQAQGCEACRVPKGCVMAQLSSSRTCTYSFEVTGRRFQAW